MRYGVLVDIAQKVIKEQPVDVTMGYFNVIWQGDSNDVVLRSIDHTASPVAILNITGPETLSICNTALEFGKLFGKEVVFTGEEAQTALLSNSGKAYSLFGKPEVLAGRVVEWTARWIMQDGKLLGKPTKFEVRDGKY